MTWPWRNLEQTRPAAPVADSGPSLDSLIATADAARSAGRWVEAAKAYEVVLQHAPKRAAIWVQLGHARKEAGDFAGAEAAYRESLRLFPDASDTHLQLGHVLKLQGLRPASIAAYARALQVDRTCTPALAELIALGEGWEAEQASSLGQHILGELVQSAHHIRTALERLERALPEAASLNSVPPAQYALFQTRFRLPPPPPSPCVAWSAVILDRHKPETMVPTLRSLATQSEPPASVTIVSTNADTAPIVARFGNAGFAGSVIFVRPEAFTPPDCDWLLLLASGSLLIPGALPWLNWATGQIDAAGFYTDEDEQPEDAGGTQSRPVLKAAFDAEPDHPLFRHTALALRRSFAERHLADAVRQEDPLQAMADAAAAEGGIGHLARILFGRIAEPPRVDAPPRPKAPAGTDRLAVVIPTRDGAAMLRPCLEALRSTAAQPGQLDIVILDNGSADSATLALLSDLEARGAARIIRDAAPFNWSRLNNTGVAACDSPLLLFLNDDVSITAPGWDDTIRRHLARPAVGAVGARLLYPNGEVQHGGIIFGPDGRAEHEGVATIGVLPDIAARWTARRSVGAVTGAMLACRRNDFARFGGFDADHFPIWFNDIDFCLRLRRAGLTIVYDPAIHATHSESRTLSAQPENAERRAIWRQTLADLRQRWGDALRTDPGFNPHFARIGRPFELMTEPSLDAVRTQLLLSAHPNPWRLD